MAADNRWDMSEIGSQHWPLCLTKMSGRRVAQEASQGACCQLSLQKVSHGKVTPWNGPEPEMWLLMTSASFTSTLLEIMKVSCLQSTDSEQPWTTDAAALTMSASYLFARIT